MERARLVVVAMMSMAGLSVHAQECRPGVRLLTVYTLSGKTTIPNDVWVRANYIAAKVLAGAGVTVEWVKGPLSQDFEKPFCGDRLTIAFEPKASAGFVPQALAYASLGTGSGTEIHIFYDRVSAFPDRSRMADYLGHVLAHEIAHVLQGVARHSSEGVMKAKWDELDCARLTRKPLIFAAEDVALIQSHFETRMAPAEEAVLVSANKTRR